MTFTKEQLQHIIETDHVQCGDASALARMALAGMEAEPVAYIIQDADARSRGEKGILSYFANISDEDINEYQITVTPLYTAPPAPVSVPNLKSVGFLFVSNDGAVAYSPANWPMKGFNLIGQIYGDVNACRAAILQGAEPVTTANKLPDDFDFDRFNDVVWLETVASNPHMHSPTTSTIAMVALELNRKLAAGNSPVIPDGWVACSEQMPENGNSIVFWHPVLCEYCIGEYDTQRKCFKYFELITEDGYSEDRWYVVDGVTHWMPLPAAPQQEVK